MQIYQNVLIDQLLSLTDNALESVKNFKQLSNTDLNHKRTPDEWSILECLEHLNLYGDFYLPEIENRLLNNPFPKDKHSFKSGMIGNYFVNTIKVKNGNIKKMKSPGDKDPKNSNLSITTIDRLLKQLEKLKNLLHQSRKVSLTKVKTAIELTKMIRLRLGDTLQFLVYHIERHILQAQRNMAERTAQSKMFQ